MRASCLNGHGGHVFKLSAADVLVVMKRTTSKIAILCSVTRMNDRSHSWRRCQGGEVSVSRTKSEKKKNTPHATLQERLMTRCTRIAIQGCTGTLAISRWRPWNSFSQLYPDSRDALKIVSLRTCHSSSQVDSWPGVIFVFDVANLKTYIYMLFDVGLV